MIVGFDHESPYSLQSTYVHYVDELVKITSTRTRKEFITKYYYLGLFEPLGEDTIVRN